MSAGPTYRKPWMRRLSHSWLRVWLVWLLCLCAWRGPVPVVHCHAVESLAHGESQPNWHLAEHLSVCHAGRHASEEMGWHLHFVLPIQGGDAKSPHPASPFLPDHDSHESPSDSSLDGLGLAEWITHDADGHVQTPVVVQSMDVLVNFALPSELPSLSPSVPKLIPLAPPRHRPARVSPRIYYCVAQC